MPIRQLPSLSKISGLSFKPLSFVTIRFSKDYDHNILRSECIRDSRNEFITLDNSNNLFFDNLSQAMNTGLEQASHELVAFVHEDVFLLPEWQSHFTVSLYELERVDPNWGVVGSVGWDDNGKLIGHWSDPHQYRNTLTDKRYACVVRLDEQILIIKKSSGLRFDQQLPVIHNIGWDISLSSKERGLRCYVLDAPTIHKYANAMGNLIQTKNDSPKIVNRSSYAWQAEKACSDEYFIHKWSRVLQQSVSSYDLSGFPESVKKNLDCPVILISRGGSGSRLLSLLAQNFGLFLGNKINESGDCIDLIIPIYKALIEKFKCHSLWQKNLIVSQLRYAASEMLAETDSISLWGFKLPESILLLPELSRAFPQARFIHLIRDPLTTCLRRTHMTARLDNEIGRITLPIAYQYFNIETRKILEDTPAVHMAYTTKHQLEEALRFFRPHPFDIFKKPSQKKWLQIRFEDILKQPFEVTKLVGSWLNLRVGDDYLRNALDINRANNPRITYEHAQEQRVRKILHHLRVRLGYVNTSPLKVASWRPNVST